MNKKQIIMNKSVYLGFSVLELSKTVMYKFWYDDVKWKYKGKAKLCYMDTNSSVGHVKTKDIYEDVAKYVEKRFDTSSDKLERSLS